MGREQGLPVGRGGGAAAGRQFKGVAGTDEVAEPSQGNAARSQFIGRHRERDEVETQKRAGGSQGATGIYAER
jgi:hypothetical protein